MLCGTKLGFIIPITVNKRPLCDAKIELNALCLIDAPYLNYLREFTCDVFVAVAVEAPYCRSILSCLLPNPITM